MPRAASKEKRAPTSARFRFHPWRARSRYLTPPPDERTRSRELFNRGFFLTEEFITVAGDNYLSAGTDPRDPRLAPLHAEVPDRVAPAYVCTAGFDPLRDEGEAYAEKLRAAGVKTELRRFPDQIHGFFNVVGAGRTAKAAATEVASALRTLAG